MLLASWGGILGKIPGPLTAKRTGSDKAKGQGHGALGDDPFGMKTLEQDLRWLEKRDGTKRSVKAGTPGMCEVDIRALAFGGCSKNISRNANVDTHFCIRHQSGSTS